MAEKQRIPESLRRQVCDRAGGYCEYCLLHESDAYFPYEADHVVAEKHGGATTLANLCWACLICNRAKGTDLASLDPPGTGRLVRLFDPAQPAMEATFSPGWAAQHAIDSKWTCNRLLVAPKRS